MADPDDLGVLASLAALFDELGIDYAVGGSLASSFCGTPRTTHDVDLIARLDGTSLATLSARLGTDWYVPEEGARRALESATAFNLMHVASALKVDVFVAGEGALDQAQLATSVRVELSAGGRPIRVTAPPMIVLRKLAWYRSGGCVSERQWRDVLGILDVQGVDAILGQAAPLAAELGLDDLLQKAAREARDAPSG